MTALGNRVRRLVERLGDPNDLSSLSDDELAARVLASRIAAGYDPSLPDAEALAAHIAQLEAELPTLSGPDQELQHRIIGLSRDELRLTHQHRSVENGR